MNAIHRARVQAGLTQAEVGAAVGRTGMWVSLVERNKVKPTKPEIDTILVAIKRLEQFKQAARESKKKLVTELRLPSRAIQTAE